MHPLKHAVMIGSNGLTEGVIAEIDLALNYHELIEVKITTEEQATKESITNAIARETAATLVQLIGSIAKVMQKKSHCLKNNILSTVFNADNVKFYFASRCYDMYCVVNFFTDDAARNR